MAECKEGFQGRKELGDSLAVSAMDNAKEDTWVVYLQYPRPVQTLNFTDEETEPRSINDMHVGNMCIDRTRPSRLLASVSQFSCHLTRLQAPQIFCKQEKISPVTPILYLCEWGQPWSRPEYHPAPCSYVSFGPCHFLVVTESTKI